MRRSATSSKSPSELHVQFDAGGPVTALVYGAHDRRDSALLLAHGAGSGQYSPFMVGFANALAALGVETITFNFPYTERKRRLPDRGPVLEACYRAVIEAVRAVVGAGRPLFIGGKSMGGRIATQVAAADPERPIAGLVLLGYPLHPPGRPAERRDAHLPAVGRPMLFIQGSRDAFGTPEEMMPALAPVTPPATLHVVAGGDHSFKVSRGGDQAAVYADAQRTIATWVHSRVPRSHES
jgi:predicted alpha/beta-hydrolase family hydrolase